MEELILLLTLMSIAFTLTVLGLKYNITLFTFISGICFIFIGLTSDRIYILLSMIAVGLMQMFNTFFEWRRY